MEQRWKKKNSKFISPYEKRKNILRYSGIVPLSFREFGISPKFVRLLRIHTVRLSPDYELNDFFGERRKKRFPFILKSPFEIKVGKF